MLYEHCLALNTIPWQYNRKFAFKKYHLGNCERGKEKDKSKMMETVIKAIMIMVGSNYLKLKESCKVAVETSWSVAMKLSICVTEKYVEIVNFDQRWK